MRDEEEKVVLEEVFGASSSDSESENESEWKWESMEEVKGLWLCNNFLSLHQQTHILSAIQDEKWFTQPNINQAMRFGLQHLPSWAIRLAHSIRRSVFASHLSLPLHLLRREPFFDQMIANVYQPGEGICAHVDLLRFDDLIAIVSFESSCVMHFTSHSETPQSGSVSVPVLLTPGSLVLLSGEARYHWKHEINRTPGFQLWQGQPLTQTRRTSITLRKLCSTT